MKHDFKLYVQSCTICGQNKPPSAYSKAPILHIVVSEFNTSLCLDHIVHERDIMTPRRHRYILSMTDMFSGFVIAAMPTRTQESKEKLQVDYAQLGTEVRHAQGNHLRPSTWLHFRVL